MDLDLKLIARLVRMMESADLTELEIEEQGTRVHLRRGREAAPSAAPVVHFASPPAQLATPAAPAPAPGPAPAEAAPAAAAPSPGQEGKPFTSPMVGTFYRAASPDAEPFVDVGKKVGPDSVLCIIEAMKVMNEIKAEVSGVILAVLAENGDAVEFGQPLFLIGPA
jgi:acetyl-CoA carboxylase biotin carboxyl carrier protein